MNNSEKTCLTCKNKNCFIVYGVPQEKKKDTEEHHENYDYNIVFDCKKHNKFKGGDYDAGEDAYEDTHEGHWEEVGE